MPDGDKIHAKLRFYYQNAYKRLCSSPFEAEKVARDVLKSIRKAIDYDGGGRPFRALGTASVRMNTLSQELLAGKSVDWLEEVCSLEQIARTSLCKKRIASLILETSKNVLHDLRNDRSVRADLLLELNICYLTNLYQAEFEEKIPLAVHYNGVSQHLVEERLEAIRPFVMNGLERFATQKCRGASMPLKLPKRTEKAKPILLHDTDLLG